MLRGGEIKTARSALQNRPGLVNRWRGTSVECAYQNLHAAEVFLVDLLSPDEVDAAVSGVVARTRAILDRDDPRYEDVEKLAELPPGPAKSVRLKNAMAVAYDAADQLHVRVRDFRNVLWVTSVLIVMLMVPLLVFVAQHPSAMPFCFEPSRGQRVCPTGRTGPSGGDIVIIAGLGLLGGALAAAFAIRTLRGTSTPYDVPIALAALKVPSGALIAVAGLLLLRGQFRPGCPPWTRNSRSSPMRWCLVTPSSSSPASSTGEPSRFWMAYQARTQRRRSPGLSHAAPHSTATGGRPSPRLRRPLQPETAAARPWVSRRRRRRSDTPAPCLRIYGPASLMHNAGSFGGAMRPHGVEPWRRPRGPTGSPHGGRESGHTRARERTYKCGGGGAVGLRRSGSTVGLGHRPCGSSGRTGTERGGSRGVSSAPAAAVPTTAGAPHHIRDARRNSTETSPVALERGSLLV